jgi:hypothetical protein
VRGMQSCETEHEADVETMPSFALKTHAP